MPNELIFAYLLCALPFAVPAGTALRRWIPFSVAVTLEGLGLAAFAGLGPAFNDFLDVADAGLAERSIVRSLLACMLLSLLFAVLPLRMSGVPLWHAAALMVALLPPLVLADRERDFRLKRFAQLEETGRLVAARREWEAAVAIGGSFEANKRTSAEWRAFLAKGIADIEKRVKRDERPSLARAFHLIQLDRMAEAEGILKELSDPQGSMLLGALHRGNERWSEAEVAFRRAIADGTATWNAYEGLADALRNQDKAEEALAIYAEAAERLPEVKALATLKRGLLLADEGRSSAAVTELEAARKLDPKLASEIDPRLRSIRASSFQCLPWR